MRNVRELTIATAVIAGGFAVSAQQPPPAGQQPQEIRVTLPARPDGPVVQIPRTPAVDQAAHDRGRGIWARECVDCHGTQARGGTGPNIIR
jgi:mono/diheme cytochrome c family protein